MYFLNVRPVIVGSFGPFRQVCSLDRVAKTARLDFWLVQRIVVVGFCFVRLDTEAFVW